MCISGSFELVIFTSLPNTVITGVCHSAHSMCFCDVGFGRRKADTDTRCLEFNSRKREGTQVNVNAVEHGPEGEARIPNGYVDVYL